MPTFPIPLGPVNRNSDDVALRDNSSRLVNGFFGDLGELKRRPGLDNSSIVHRETETTCSVIGVHYWPDSNTVAVITNEGLTGKAYWGTRDEAVSRILVIAAGGGTNTFSGTTPSSRQPRSTAATDGTWLFVAQGGAINYLGGGGGTFSYVTDVDAPTAVSHLAYLDGYLLANRIGQNKFYWSDVNDSFSWTATSFASASGNSDFIIALHVVDRRIHLFGQSSVEVWYNDGVTPFIRDTNGYYSTGCGAAHSIVTHDSALYWISHTKQFVKMEGGSIQELQSPFDSELSRIADISDSLGSKINIQGQEMLVWNIPRSEKTYCYNTSNNTWCEFGEWSGNDAAFRRWQGNAAMYVPAWGAQLVGSRESNRVLLMDDSTYTDLGNDSLFSFTTGHINHGTTKDKRSDELRITVKRGRSSTTSLNRDAVLMVRWRDNGRNVWSSERQLSLGSLGEQDMILTTHRTGAYRTRQWQFSVSDPVDVVISAVEEDVTFLR